MGFKEEEKDVAGYLQKGFVSDNDAFVIAINSRLLRGYNGTFPEIAGISQLPFAVEAAYAVGPIEVMLDNNFTPIKQQYSYRTKILKQNNADVSTSVFLNEENAMISAIWAVDLDETVALGRMSPMAVVHNPYAKNPLPHLFLPSDNEYSLESDGDYFNLRKDEGKKASLSDRNILRGKSL